MDHYRKILRFADAPLKNEVNGYLRHITERNEAARWEAEYLDIVQEMGNAKTESALLAVSARFAQMGNYKDCATLSETCAKRAQTAREEAYRARMKFSYQELCRKMNQTLANDSVLVCGITTAKLLEELIPSFEQLNGWEDSEEKIAFCRQKSEEIRLREKQKQIEFEHREAAARARVKRRTIIVLSVLGAILVIYSALFYGIIPDVKYAGAVKALKEGNIADACIAFEQLGTYKDSTARLENIKSDAWDEAFAMLTQGQFEKALEILDAAQIIVNAKSTEAMQNIADGNWATGISALEIETFSVPKGTVSIPDNAFLDCTKLKTVILPDSVVSIGENAFRNCTSLQSITLSSSLQSIGAYAFHCCTSLQSVTLPSSLEFIGAHAFSHCDDLTAVVIPDSVKTIQVSAFTENASLTTIQFGKNIDTIAIGVCKNCPKLTSVVLGEKTKQISVSAFEGCSALKTIVLPDELEEISANAFNGCSSLTEIAIPAATNKIGIAAFKNCSRLSAVYFADAEGWGAVYWDSFDLHDPYINSVCLSVAYTDYLWSKKTTSTTP